MHSDVGVIVAVGCGCGDSLIIMGGDREPLAGAARPLVERDACVDRSGSFWEPFPIICAEAHRKRGGALNRLSPSLSLRGELCFFRVP